MAIELITEPGLEPVSYEQALIQLRINIFDESLDVSSVEELERFITVVREDAENFTNRKFITQTWRYYLDRWPKADYIELPFNPLQSISSVKYTDLDGTETALVENTDFIVDKIGLKSKIVLPYSISWPTATLAIVNPIKIEAIYGYGDNPEDIPKRIIQAILIQVVDLYENRQGIVRGQPIQRLNTYERLLSPFQIYYFGAER